MGNKRLHITIDEIWDGIHLYLKSKGINISGTISYWVRGTNTGDAKDIYIDILSDKIIHVSPINFNDLIKENKTLKEKLKSKENKPIPKTELPKTELPKPDDDLKSQSSSKIDLQKLRNIVKSTIDLSDVFVSESKEDRKLILRELDVLCEDPNATIESLKPND